MMMSMKSLKAKLYKHARWLNHHADGERAVFDRVNLRGVNFCFRKFTSSLSHAVIINSDFTGAQLQGVSLYGAVIRESMFIKANFHAANLQCVDFHGTKLQEANFSRATLLFANFSFANLEQADFTSANLRGCNLYMAKLSGVDLDNTLLPAPTEILQANWDGLSATVTRKLMAFDMSCHHNPEAFIFWKEDEGCPYGRTSYSRVANFSESKKLFRKNIKAPSVIEAMELVLKAKTKNYRRELE